MQTFIRSLAEEIGLPEEAYRYAEPIALLLEGDPLLAECWETLLSRGDGAGLLDGQAERFGCEPNRLKLAAALLLTRNMRAEYERQGIDLAVWRDSLADIPIWANCCRAETGRWGMQEFPWLQNTLAVRLWRLGRLQFERVSFAAESFDLDGMTLRKGDPVINVHIPEGAPLTPEAVDDAFRRAVAFFGQNVFVCSSWMLWPAHLEMLPESSNIRRFQERFRLVEHWEGPGVGDLWRIFGYLPDYSPDRLPRDTGLRRAYAQRLEQNGGLTGGGYGVYVVL